MRFERHRPRNDDERILPLINIVFLLLIFFMLAGHLAAADPFQVEPPVSASRDESGGDLLVLVAADGRLAVDADVVDAAGLRAVVEHRHGERKTVRLKADGGAPATRVVEVMEVLRAAGVEKLRLLTVTDTP